MWNPSDTDRWGLVNQIEPRFAPMIERLERLAAGNVRQYRGRIIAAGLFGYLAIACIAFMPLLLFVAPILALTSLSVGTDISIAVGLMMLALFAALRLPPTVVAGEVVSPDEVPVLFALLDRMATAAGLRIIFDVRITPDFNATILRERPLFGTTTTRMQVGLPLLFGLREDDVEAIVAHELGHLISPQAWISDFIYRVRLRWVQLGGRFSKAQQGRTIRRFFEWYGPWFLATTIPFARQEEFAADCAAGRMITPQAMATALTRGSMAAARFDELMGRVKQKAARRISVPIDVWRKLLQQLSRDYYLDGPSILNSVLHEEPNFADTHPSLVQRLAALRQSPALPPPLGVSAATALLGSAAERLVKQFDADMYASWHLIDSIGNTY